MDCKAPEDQYYNTKLVIEGPAYISISDRF